MKQEWKYSIRSQSKTKLNFREIWEYRDLIILFIKRDFVSKYKQTILGPLWAIIQPVLTTIVFTIIFGNIAKLSTADVDMPNTYQIPSFLFFMTGNIIWNYFSQTVQFTSNTFIANMRIMSKVYYPRMATPIATSLSNLISFIIQLVLFFVLAICFYFNGQLHIEITTKILLLPVLIIQLIFFSMGIGIILSALTTKYRDLMMLVSFGLELWKYATPVAYGLKQIPEAWLNLYLINPMTSIVLTFRTVTLGIGYFNWLYYGLSFCVSIMVFLIGMYLFNKVEKNFADTV